MAASIDPVDNIFGTGVSLLQRILIGFAAGWLGNLLSRVCASITSWEAVKNPGEIFAEIASDFGATEVLGFVLWPLITLYYLLKAPIYALILIPLVILSLIRIVFTDDPILFWTVLIVALLVPGLVFTDGTAWSWIPLGFVMVGLGSALWWSLNYEHGHWIDEVKFWFQKE